MKSDIEIARSIKMRPIGDIAKEAGIPVEKIEPYGHYMAKLPDNLKDAGKASGPCA